MIKLVVGLGNPGLQYSKTRHNAGFWFLERLPIDGVSWGKEARFRGSVASKMVGGVKVLLLKPETYMNCSGQSVAALTRYFKIDPGEVLVVHDELDFEPGDIRLKKKGGHAGHNGLRDIIASLGTKDFWRLRIGIGRPPGQQKVVDYVLTPPSKLDKEKIIAGFDPVYAGFSQLISGGGDQLMQRLNEKNP